ncbi:hypothetical protein SAMN05192533_10889 [Mesobacillus persicus]|uniref:Uncharacterized protein n=1 Tax=Mesobacillus persicus TaxID=930146 RepID=A0A1H8D5W6_9BACI|nr:hypothetical protein [Mesobacillus persicus]SEN02586.1 hypothetical protein SAMN05192533_10889 [Mesobacillus persicus]
MEKSELNEILNALKLHSEHIDKKMDVMKTDLEKRIGSLEGRMGSLEGRMGSLEGRMDSLDTKMDVRFDRLEKKVDGIRVDLTETQETVNFLSSKYAQHEKKLQTLINQQSQ